MGKVTCECPHCNCKEQFEYLSKEDYQGLAHDLLYTKEQVQRAATRVGMRICKRYQIGQHWEFG